MTQYGGIRVLQRVCANSSNRANRGKGKNIAPLPRILRSLWLCWCRRMSIVMPPRMTLKWTLSCTLFLCVVAFGTASGQSTTNESAPNIEILKLKWEKQTRLPKDFDPSVIPTGVIFSEPESQTIRPGTSAATTASRAVTIAETNPSTQENGTFGNAPARMPVFYVYSMKVKNVGAKTIQGMAWDYYFLDPISNAVVGRHQILSFTNLA